MAYMIALGTCRGEVKPEVKCQKKVTHEVFNNRNGTHGKYCESCAKKLVEELKKYER